MVKIGAYFLLDNPFLEEVDIPDSLEYIGEHFFEECPLLKRITMSRNAKVKLSEEFEHLIVYQD